MPDPGGGPTHPFAGVPVNPSKKQHSPALAVKGVFCRILVNNVPNGRLYCTPKPPRTTTRSKPLYGNHAKPRRGAKLFRSLSNRSFTTGTVPLIKPCEPKT